MLCGKNKKTDRCMQVYLKKDTSSDREINHTTKQKRCKRKTIKNISKPKPKSSKKKCPPGKVLNPKTGLLNDNWVRDEILAPMVRDLPFGKIDLKGMPAIARIEYEMSLIDLLKLIQIIKI